MKKQLEICGAAQPFGFGGITELAAIEGGLRQFERGREAKIHLLREPQFEAVLSGSRHRFALMDCADTDNYLRAMFNNHDSRRFDAVVSSYETAAVFYGWFNGIPVYFYDGMLWFWDFEKYAGDVSRRIEALGVLKESGDRNGLVDFYKKLVCEDYHLSVFLAYHLSDKVYARGGVGIEDKLHSIPEVAGKVKVVGAVISPGVDFCEFSEREHVLVSLSGSLAPTVSFEQNLQFARGALSFALEAFEQMNLDIPWVFSCHPRIYEVLKNEGLFGGLPSKFSAEPSFTYEKNLSMISRASALFVSPGFSSVQEAANFGTPVFFLPEQNGGQPTGFSSLKSAGYPADFNLTVTDHVNGSKPVLGERDVDSLYEGVARMFGVETEDLRAELLAKFKAVLLDRNLCEQLVLGQRTAVSEIIGGFDGALVIAEDILNSLR